MAADKKAEIFLKRVIDQQQGYMIAMRSIMTLMVADRPVTAANALALAKAELEPQAFMMHKEALAAIVGDVAAAAARLRASAEGQAQ